MSKFKVGQKWRARNGDVFKIIKDLGSKPFPIIARLTGAGQIISADRNGMYAGSLLSHDYDLVELVFDPTAPTCGSDISPQVDEGHITSAGGPRGEGGCGPTPRIKSNPKPAAEILRAAMVHLDDRAQQYDSPQGERSMGATVEAFKAVTGVSMTETQGWIFMALLKAVRSQQGGFKIDSYEDGAAYFALAGEAASRAGEGK